MILIAILLPVSIMLLFTILKKAKDVDGLNNNIIIVKVPEMVLWLGIICASMSIVVMACFTFFSNEKPHIIFYLVFGSFLWLGIFLIVKTIIFRVVVIENKIMVYPVLKRAYSFTFDEIVSVIRQVKKNQVKSERIVIKTKENKKLIIENSEISYERFKKKLEKAVDKSVLVGFDNIQDNNNT